MDLALETVLTYINLCLVHLAQGIDSAEIY